MYTRIAQCTIKPGGNAEFTKVFTSEILPELTRQTGFVDSVAVYGDTDPRRVVSITFWNSKESAEQYGREVYPRLIRKLEPLSSDWTVQGYNVEVSTMHRVGISKAA
jgi:hypothetical protein